jgi:hypothetical protein
MYVPVTVLLSVISRHGLNFWEGYLDRLGLRLPERLRIPTTLRAI